uniref:C6 domain-containing protein n=1 Tax=Meloidogyne floridensis TaxID=298350 RepID=A0A915NUE9_9BILA
MTAMIAQPIPACAACSLTQLMLTPGNGMTSRGPISNPGSTLVTATLDCVGGQWMFQQGGIDRIINEINCQNEF